MSFVMERVGGLDCGSESEKVVWSVSEAGEPWSRLVYVGSSC